MGWILAFIVLAFIAFEGLIGYKKGFLQILLSMAAFVVALICSVVFLNPVSTFLKTNTSVYDSLEEGISDYVEEHELYDEEALEDTNLPSAIKKSVSKTIEEKKDNIEEAIADTLTKEIFKATVTIMIFLVVYVAIKVIAIATGIFNEIPVIKHFNRGGGLGLGLVYALGLVWVMCILVSALSTTTFGKNIMEIINENLILSFIYNHNLLQSLLSGLGR